MSEGDLFRRALRVSPEPMTLSRLRDGVLVDVSDSFCRLTGFARSDLVDRPASEIGLWVDPAQRAEMVRQVGANGEVRDFEALLRDSQGRIRTHLVGATRLDGDADPLLLSIGHDVTDRVRIERALVESERRYRRFVESMPLGVIVTQDGDLKYANPQAARMSGYTIDELVGRPFAPMIHEDDRARVSDLHRRRMAGEVACTVYELRMWRADGALRHWRVHVQTVDWEGQPSGLSILTDITDQVSNDRRLRELSSIVEQASDAIMLTSTDGRIQYVNPGFERMTGYAREEVVGKTPAIVKSGAHDANFYRQLWETVSAGRPFHAQVVNRRKDGSLYHAVKTITPMFDDGGRIASYVNIDKDFTVQHEAQQRTAHLAMHDSLTGLPNRNLLSDCLVRAIAQFDREGSAFALLFIDLDGFKAINDSHGHRAGDEVLREVACRLREGTRSVDTIARIGGDEFVVLLTGVADLAVAAKVAGELVQSIKQPIALPARKCQIGVSVGVSVFPVDGRDVDAILNSADHAMYAAKRAGGNRLQAAMEINPARRLTRGESRCESRCES